MIDVDVWTPEAFGRPLRGGILPYGSFIVFLKVTDTGVSPPFTVDISELPKPSISLPGGFTIGGGCVLQLRRATKIRDPYTLFREYPVSNLSSFEMKWKYVSFPVKMNIDAATIDAFKGSTMLLTVRNNSGFTAREEIPILNANPNNHYHWRRQQTFVDGWYFKCVHVDRTSLEATPFFFLYGVNNPAGGTSAESFVMCAKGGTIALSPGLQPTPGAVPSAPDPQYWSYGWSSMRGETLYGLDASITSDFGATDSGCRGRKILPSGETVSWDLTFTKVHTSCQSDYNPLAPFELLMELNDPDAFLEYPAWPLMHHFNRALFMTAYYMSHNMDSLISGTVNWRGTNYVLNNDKGYQDGNWGAGGFPHPYVWMQANNFSDSGGTPLHDTSLVSLFTPGMPWMFPFTGTGKVGGICFRHSGRTYRFFDMDKSLFGVSGVTRAVIDAVRDIGPITCQVTFRHAGMTKTVDVANPSAITAAIDPFPRTPEAKPVQWSVTGENDDGDRIEITVDCAESSVISLPAPLAGRMTPGVTKETLHATFTVKITPDGENSQTVYSNFGVAEFGD